jgi:hypothetical protein
MDVERRHALWRAFVNGLTPDPAGIIAGMSRAGREAERLGETRIVRPQWLSDAGDWWSPTEGYREVWNSRDGWLVGPDSPAVERK